MCSELRANTLKVIRFLDIIAMAMYFVMSLLLLISYLFLQDLAPGMQTAANMEYVTWFFLIGVAFSLVSAIICVFYVYNWFVLRPQTKHIIIAELIYILGLEPAPKRLDGEGREDPLAAPIPLPQDTESVESIYGFGHDKEEQWTYAGKRPKAQTKESVENPPEDKVSSKSVDMDTGVGGI